MNTEPIIVEPRAPQGNNLWLPPVVWLMPPDGIRWTYELTDSSSDPRPEGLGAVLPALAFYLLFRFQGAFARALTGEPALVRCFRFAQALRSG